MNLLKKNKKSGAAMLITVFFFLGVSLTLAYAATIGVTTELRTYRTLASSKASYIAADAGAEDAYYRVLKGMAVSPTYTIGLMPAAATATVAYNSGDDSYDINVAAQSLEQVRRMQVHVSRNMSLPMRYAVASGVGGVHMGQNTFITSTDGSGGDIYALGLVQGAGSNKSTIQGDVTVGAGLDPYMASSSACSSDETLSESSTGRWADVAQEFAYTGTSDDIIGKVDLMLKRTGNPDDLLVSIYSDNSGQPGTDLADQLIPSSLALSSGYQWVSVNFTDPPFLLAGQNYWIVARYSTSAPNAGKKWYWCYGPDAFPAWAALARNGVDTSGTPGPWSDAGGDLAFRTYLGGGTSKMDSLYVNGVAKSDSISNAKVAQDAYYASNGTLTSTTVLGIKYPGSPTPPRPSLPVTNDTRDQWIQDAEDGGYVPGGTWSTQSVGPREATSSVTVTNNSVITITGTVHIKGDLTLSNNVTMKCASAFLGTSCLVIVDGSINLVNNVSLSGSGTSGSFLVLYTTIDGCVPNAPSPPADCLAGASGVAGIVINNNVSGALFYAEKSSIAVLNNATITSVFGYYIDMANNTTIMYDPLAQFLRFSPSTAEIVGKYRVNSWDEI